MKRLLITVLTLIPGLVWSQIVPGAIGYYKDALNFTDKDRGGSARFQGLAGAGVALGGDISSVNLNPAGLGFYRKSEMSITPQFNMRNNNATYLGSLNTSYDNNVAINNIGTVISFAKSDYERSDFKGGALAITYTKTNDFNNEVELTGDNFQTSLVDSYLEQAQGQSLNSIYGSSSDIIANPLGLAYETFLFDVNVNDSACILDPGTCGNYEIYYPFEANRQTDNIRTNGNQSQLNIAYGGNFNDKFYFGANLGIASINYQINRTYTERVLNDQTDVLQSFTLNDDLSISGSGFNLNVGFIYRPIDLIRFGASLETPTIYSLEEEFGGSLDANFNNYEFNDEIILNDVSAELARGFFEYNLRTPMRANFGTALFFSKDGFLTLDAEYVDYSSSNISFDSNTGDETADNTTIQNIYTPAWNIRVGAEYRVDQIRIRGGYGNFGDPFNNNYNSVDQTRQRVSGGFGMRLADYFWDIAVVHDWWNEGYSPYAMLNPELTPSASLTKKITSIMGTVGFNF